MQRLAENSLHYVISSQQTRKMELPFVSYVISRELLIFTYNSTMNIITNIIRNMQFLSATKKRNLQMISLDVIMNIARSRINWHK